MRITLFIALVLLSSCATGPLYSPATGPDQAGYSETRLTDTRYRVTFVGRSSTSADQVSNFALLRAAELTLENGYDWFRVVSRDTEGQPRRNLEPRISIGVGHACYPFGCSRLGSPWYTGVGVSSAAYRDRYRSSLEIIMGSGEPEDPSEVYNAGELYRYLRDGGPDDIPLGEISP